MLRNILPASRVSPNMRIAVVCNDTRGGIQPYVALALGLQAAGHDVRAVAPIDLAPMFTSRGIPAATLTGGTADLQRVSREAAEKGIAATIQIAARRLPDFLATWTRETFDACHGVDLMTGGIGGMAVGLAVAEKLDIPFIETHLQPVGAPTTRYPGALLPGVPRWLGNAGRLASHHLSELAIWGPFRPVMASARKKILGLRGRPRPAAGPVFYAFSRHVVPVPDSDARPRHVTGYWNLAGEPGWQPSPQLHGFLSRPEPVVSIGFGSMASQDPAALTDLVTGAVRDAGVRAVVLSGWGGLSNVSSEDIFAASAMPHDWLFPRVAAIVHHGGAGTTGAALQAGVPSIVIPFTMDQPFWASRVRHLAVGPEPIPRARLTRRNLADALRAAVADDAMKRRASELGRLLRSENGVARAVSLFPASA